MLPQTWPKSSAEVHINIQIPSPVHDLLNHTPWEYDFLLNFFLSLYLFICFKILLEYSWFIMSIVSGIWQSDSVIHIFIHFQILYPHRLLQNIECTSLCCTLGSCWLSILYIVLCACQQQAPNLFSTPHHVSPLVTIRCFLIYESVS